MLKTIVISLTSLIIGTIASVLVTPLISCLATGVIISGVREAGDLHQTLPVFKDEYKNSRSTSCFASLFPEKCHISVTLFSD
ncbi:hypothetical protein JT651_001446 [Escherichia coli]|uniref:hypothetical protein n=1 Tax=Escherichia coli TaxID=562 RepID=UPI000BE50DB5|nr:hypothetical protein [Escherichia coli]EEZ5324682.1 hypothetical protein [Escherichia coli]EGK3582465.1 hypothetical protein [Escherichia coli]EHC2077401.1 hypothetical protein [Escherichia coli]MBB8110432.1 hypothetical protein [Escherichia coli]